ncbi:MAG: hypothetical protein ABFS42_12430 [Candidatus Krumholzibacteriota bacterium]
MRQSQLSVIFALILVVGFVIPAMALEDPPPLILRTDPVFYPDGTAASSFYGIVTDDAGNVYTVDSSWNSAALAPEMGNSISLMALRSIPMGIFMLRLFQFPTAGLRFLRQFQNEVGIMGLRKRPVHRPA